MKRGFMISLLVLVGGITIIAGFITWRSSSRRADETARFHRAQAALAAGQPARAREFIQEQNARGFFVAKLRAAWPDLEIAALEKTEPLPARDIVNFYDWKPQLFRNHEKASTVVARSLLETHNLKVFRQLRDLWRGRETDEMAWFALDADALTVDGKPDAALAFLKQNHFSGADDGPRLARIGLLLLPSNLAEATNYLNQACAVAPRNPDVRSLRASVFEQIGDPRTARLDYIAACRVDPGNPFWWDQLGEFYRRYGKFDLALRTWAPGVLLKNSKDYLWAKTLFWSRVIQPVRIQWNERPVPAGDLGPFVKFLIALPEDRYWREDGFQKIAEARRFEAQRQEIFWLRLIDALAQRQESDALASLKFNRFRTHSWNPEIESALLRILTFRDSGRLRFPFGVSLALSPLPPGARHPLFEALDTWTRRADAGDNPPADLERLLKSDGVFSAVFIAAGWREAGLKLLRSDKIPADVPEWVAVDLAQAIRVNRGTDAALAFIDKQQSNPELAALKGELLARLALAKGDARAAEKIYSEIVNESVEAKAYLARRAFAAKDLSQAKKLTEELVRQLPNQAQLYKNLAAIKQAALKK